MDTDTQEKPRESRRVFALGGNHRRADRSPQHRTYQPYRSWSPRRGTSPTDLHLKREPTSIAYPFASSVNLPCDPRMLNRRSRIEADINFQRMHWLIMVHASLYHFSRPGKGRFPEMSGFSQTQSGQGANEPFLNTCSGTKDDFRRMGARAHSSGRARCRMQSSTGTRYHQDRAARCWHLHGVMQQSAKTAVQVLIAPVRGEQRPRARRGKRRNRVLARILKKTDELLEMKFSKVFGGQDPTGGCPS